MLEKDPVAAANRHLAVATRVPGKSQARCRIEQMSLQTAARDAVHAALDHTVKGIAAVGDQRSLLAGYVPVDVELRCRGWIVSSWRPVGDQVVPLPERPIQADTHAEVQCQVL